VGVSQADNKKYREPSGSFASPFPSHVIEQDAMTKVPNGPSLFYFLRFVLMGMPTVISRALSPRSCADHEAPIAAEKRPAEAVRGPAPPEISAGQEGVLLS
jgi:hypothetical protein